MIPVLSFQEAVMELKGLLQGFDKATLISLGYATYLYVIMDAGNARARARRRYH